MAAATERLGRFLNTVESRWSLYALLQGSGLVASFGLPAWAVRSAQIFSDYAPLSWVVGGFVGVLVCRKATAGCFGCGANVCGIHRMWRRLG
jgi:hypothetical protein